MEKRRYSLPSPVPKHQYKVHFHRILFKTMPKTIEKVVVIHRLSLHRMQMNFLNKNMKCIVVSTQLYLLGDVTEENKTNIQNKKGVLLHVASHRGTECGALDYFTIPPPKKKKRGLLCYHGRPTGGNTKLEREKRRYAIRTVKNVTLE